MRVRRAGYDDAAGIALVHVRSWQAAYRGLLPQDFLDRLDPARRAEGWRRILAAAEPPSEVLVAEEDRGIVGFAHVSPSRDADADPATVGEITAIYLLPQAWGTGVGRRLMSVALDRLAAAGFHEATLWVLDSNTRARRFYEAGGWHPDGRLKEDRTGRIVVTEARYRRPIDTGREP